MGLEENKTIELVGIMEWNTLDTVPKDGTPIILANFNAQCLLTGAPHVWTARWVSHTQDFSGEVFEEEDPHFWECSHAAMNENGEPTHWMPLPKPPEATDE